MVLTALVLAAAGATAPAHAGPSLFEDDGVLEVTPIDGSRVGMRYWNADGGVADAQVLGGANPLVKISLDRRKLEFYGITAEEVFRVVTSLDDLLSDFHISRHRRVSPTTGVGRG